MRNLSLAVLAMVMLLVSFAGAALAQGNPRGTTSLTLKGKAISVEYGRPSLKGRTTDDLLGRLEPGSLWRLGADQSTTFKTATDLVFGDVSIPAGEYSIWMQRQADNSWKLLFDKQHGQWGAPAPAASEAFAAVPLQDTKLTTPVEMVTLTLRKAAGGGTLTIQWGTLQATAGFKAK